MSTKPFPQFSLSRLGLLVLALAALFLSQAACTVRAPSEPGPVKLLYTAEVGGALDPCG